MCAPDWGHDKQVRPFGCPVEAFPWVLALLGPSLETTVNQHCITVAEAAAFSGAAFIFTLGGPGVKSHRFDHSRASHRTGQVFFANIIGVIGACNPKPVLDV